MISFRQLQVLMAMEVEEASALSVFYAIDTS
jgi:hypothetical protein